MKCNKCGAEVRAKVEEPLEELAKRKGCDKIVISPPTKIINEWDIELRFDGLNINPFEDGCATYAECEAKARAHLEGLDDVKGGKV